MIFTPHEFTPAGLKEQAQRIVAIRMKAKQDEYDVVAEVITVAEERGFAAADMINGMRELADALEFIEETQTEADDLAEVMTQMPVDENDKAG